MENRFDRFTLRLLISCLVAMMAFAPASLLAGGSANKAEGKDRVIASSTTTSEQGKQDTMKGSDEKDDEDGDSEKGEK